MSGDTNSRLRKGLARDNNEHSLSPDLLLAAGQRKPSTMKPAALSSPSWSAICRTYWRDYVVLLVLLVLLVVSEVLPPYHRWIYHHGTAELWRYSYPLYTSNTVPAWLVPVIALCVPAAVLAAHARAAPAGRLEAHNAVLGALGCVLSCALVTNLVKLQVGRPRPNFAARCWLGRPPSYDSDGFPDCNPDAIHPDEGRKSFPSGHTSWSTSGLGYLSFWAAGKMRVFSGHGHLWQLLLAGLPLQVAVCIGISRLQDYWHHWEDVVAGFALGLLFAYAFYRQHFHGVASPRAGQPLLTGLEGAGGNGLPEVASLGRLPHPHSYSQLELQGGGLGGEDAV